MPFLLLNFIVTLRGFFFLFGDNVLLFICLSRCLHLASFRQNAPRLPSAF